MKNQFFALCLCLLCLTSTSLFAVPAIPYPVEITQPDGASLTIRLHGDEHFHYTTTEDGYMIVKNQQDFYVYATVSQFGEMEASTRIARNAHARTAVDASFLRSLDVAGELARLRNVANVKQIQKVAAQQELNQVQRTPKTGSPKFLVLLIEFSDRAFVNRSTAQTRYSNLLNEQGYSANSSTGSVKDYYAASSYGKFTPVFEVIAPVTLSQTAKYYCNNDGEFVPQMVIDACNAVNSTVNFADYDNDGDNYVDNVLCFVAGWDRAQGAADATNVWSHRWAVQPGYNYSGTQLSTYFDSKRVFDYFVTSELRGSSGTNMVNIGTFCHEFGHIIGLPDYYHTDSDKNTLSTWSLMDSGNYNNVSRTPPAFSAYDRFFMGWLTPEEYFTGTKTLYPLSQLTTPPTTGQAYLLSASSAHNLIGSNPNPSEFFILEYREKTGWDAYLPTAGMLIWHIDYNATIWSNNTVNNYTGTNQTQASHMRVYLEPINGLSQTTPGGAFTTGSFSPKLWNGTNINRPITDITKNGTTSMNFGTEVLLPKAPTAFTVTPDAGGALSAELQWTNPTQTTSGSAVTLTKVEAYRDGTLIHTNNSPVAGAIETYTDNSPTNGNHTYTVYAYNASGVSAPATVSVFVGDITPADGTVFYETFGEKGPTANPRATIGGYTDYDNGAPVIFSSSTTDSPDIRSSSTINTHVWFPSDKSTDLVISNIPATGYKNLKLSFDVACNAANSNVNKIIVEVNDVPVTVPSVALPQSNKYVNSGDISILASNVIKVRFYYTAANNPLNYGYRLDNIKITGTSSIVVEESVPKAPTAFTVTPDAGGALSAELQWTNPTETTSGSAVTLSKMEAYRDGTLIYTNNSPVAGAVETYTDNSPTTGNHTYTVYAYNASGASEPATVSVFVGDITPTDSTVFYETFGEKGPTANPRATIGGYTDYDNGAPVIFSSSTTDSPDIRSSSTINTHVWFPSEKSTDLVISNIPSTGYKDLKLSFDVACNAANSNVNKIIVEVNDVPVAVPSVALPQSNKYVNSGDIAIDAADPVKLRFYYTAANNPTGYGYRLDNVKITGTPVLVGIDNFSGDQVYFSVSGNTLLAGNLTQGTVVEIYNIVGTKMQSSVFAGSNIELNNFPQGVYIVRAGKYSQKIIF